jgi:ABC-2 type transport system ATP-binding protein
VTLLTSRAVELAQLSALPGAVEVVATDASSAAFQFQTVDANASVAALMRLLNETRVELVDLQVRKASLEDVFLRLTSRTEEVAA